MTFPKLCQYFNKLDKTDSRNQMTEILAELLSEASDKEVAELCYLALGRLAARYESLEFQLAEKMVIRAIAEGFDLDKDKVKREYKQFGDLGEVFEKLSKNKSGGRKHGNGLTVPAVYKRLKQIAQESGEGSQQRKLDGLVGLLKELDPLSGKYAVRIVLGKLRLGFSDVTILDALSWMAEGDKSLRPDIEKAFFVQADIGKIATLFKKQGIEALSQIKAELGVPIMPALCQRLKSAAEMIEKMGEVSVEPKYDGQRLQIHFRRKAKGKDKKDWKVRAFTRNMEKVSFMFPELDELASQIGSESVILDSEAVGFDPESEEILPFQRIITRKRKYAIKKAAEEVPVKFFVFDLLFRDGESLIAEPYKDRAKVLDEVVEGEGVLVKTDRIVTQDPDELREYHSKKLDEGLEGAVVKKWDDVYIPGRRGFSWVKFKEAEDKKAGLADTLDCVVMGYYRGRGKRAVFGIGGFLAGVRKGERFLTVSKIGTGLTDKQWKEMKNRADKQKVKKKPKAYFEVEKTLVPDVWVNPSIVVEIAADNITRSPVHSAGLALRFPRLERFRDDKSTSQATTLKELQKLHKMQKQQG